jgi:putative ABC transport system permease protein
MALWEAGSASGFAKNTPSPANYLDWQEQNGVFGDIAAYAGTTRVLTGGDPEEVLALRTTAGLFPVLGVAPMLGRVILPADDSPQAARVAVISHGLWQRRFGGDSNIVGRTILLSGMAHTVVGVMPPAFQFPGPEIEIWVPMAFTPAEAARRSVHFLQVVGRLKHGVTLEAARAEMRAIARRLEQQYPESNTNVGALVVPLAEDRVGDVRAALLILAGAVLLVLLGACANVANLLMVRAASRRREIAIRLALGAGSARVWRQLLTESLVLSAAATAAGVGLALGGLRVLNVALPQRVLHGSPIHMDWAVLAFAAGLSVVTALLFGTLPAYQSASAPAAPSLSGGGRGASTPASGVLRSALVVAELASALVLLVGAGLLVQSFARLIALDLGFDPSGLLTMRVALPAAKYPDADSRSAFYDRMLQRIGAAPDVESAGVVSNLPLDFAGGALAIAIEGDAPYPPNQYPVAAFRVVSPAYFRTMRIRLTSGRPFAATDRGDTPGVTIVSEAAARRHWPGQDPMGRRLKIGLASSNSPWLTVVGVARDVHQFGIGDVRPQIYVPYTQFSGFEPQYLAVRARSGDPMRLAADIRQRIRAVDDGQPAARVRSMEDIVAAASSDRRFDMVLLTTFAGLAMLLASVGLYGVVSSLVSQRTREMGLRLALGASPASILGLVLGQGARLVAAGALLGLALAGGLTRLLSGLLFGVGALDPTTFAATTAGLVAVSLAAAAIPALRASRVDPAITLRAE